jgi:Uma2 family endonuclease
MWAPDPWRQKSAEYTVDDVLNLPEDAPRVELLDGVMLVVPSQTIGHQDIAGLLWAWLRGNAPAGFRAAYAVGIRLDPKNGRDRFEKPGLYASAGIPYYWRVEQDPTVHVYAYGLREERYQLLADSDALLALGEPFPITLPIEAIRP